MNIKSAIIIGLSIIISVAIMSISLVMSVNALAPKETENRYKFTKMNDSVFILSDLQTGQSWVGKSFDLPKIAADCPALQGNLSPN